MRYTILLWITMVAASDEQPYCSIRYKRLCQGKGRHVACHFPDPGPSASCLNYTAIKFNSELKNFILYYVNRRRQRIAAGNERVRGGIRLPKPEVMMLVEWDRELAFLAQRLADQCNFVHDNCRATLRYPYAGQTVGEVRWRRIGEPDDSGAKRSIRRVLDAWWGERRRVTVNQLTAPFRLLFRGAVWGHFSQLCMWELQAMGCGAVHHGATHPRVLLVCDFSHTNMLGQRTLNPGPLAPCPIHTARRARTQYPLLCAPVRPVVTSVEPEEDGYDEEEGDYDPGLTLDIGDAPTPSIHYTRSIPMSREPSRSMTHRPRSSVLMFRENPNTKDMIVEKLDRELDRSRSYAEYTTEDRTQKRVVTEDSVTQKWRSRRPVHGQWQSMVSRAGFYSTMLTSDREVIDGDSSGHQEDLEQLVIPLRRSTSREHRNKLDYYTRTTTTAADLVNYPRARWKQTRDRPVRPGVSALLVTQPVKHGKQRPAPSLKLDKDDMEQLFRDTGFKMS